MGGVITKFIEGVIKIASASTIEDDAIQDVLYGFLVLGAFLFVGAILFISTQKPPADNVQKLLDDRQLFLNKTYSNLNGQKSLYNSLIKELDPLEQYLINLQPLTAMFGGFIGPELDGVFSAEYYLQNALRMGIRSFVLPISVYNDSNKVPPYWPYSGKPAIVFRDKSGIITSRNALSIQKFCENILTYQNANQAQSSEPILLHIVPVEGFTPDPVKEEKEYVTLMRDIANELKIINSRRLMTIGAFGSALGGQHETEILTQVHLNDMKNKILIFTTFDTKLALKDDYKNLTPNLYEYANFLPKPLVQDAGNTTTQPNVLQGSNKASGSYLIKLADISGSKINWPDQSRTKLYFADLESPLQAPVKDAVANALKVGIHIIPIPFFYTPFDKNMEEIYKLWGGHAWKLKEQNTRFKKPVLIVPSPPNTKMNARVDNKLEPGQTVVQ